jgi:hypothetical protein
LNIVELNNEKSLCFTTMHGYKYINYMYIYIYVMWCDVMLCTVM